MMSIVADHGTDKRISACGLGVVTANESITYLEIARSNVVDIRISYGVEIPLTGVTDSWSQSPS